MIATLRGHTCRYVVEGQAGPPVLLIMGFGMSGIAWRPVFEAQRDAHRLCWYDVRGLGQSSSGDAADGATMASLADDAAALLDTLGWERAHVAGVSMGGMIAQHLALRHRDRVRSLALIATHAGGGPHRLLPSPRGLRLFVQANLARTPAERLEALKRVLYTDEALARPDAMPFSPDDLQAISTPSDPGVRLRHLRAILRHDTYGRLGELADLPTLVLRGDEDVLVRPAQTDRMARAIPGARLVAVPRAGHGVLSEKAAEVNAALRAHWTAAA
ncbi:MAG: alpha/beta fold hydrolase [Alphaproteobacteria bacterium]|nr:alpha/beta fold hydrolase [Alphaproteobacteria bacterium]